MAEALRRAQHFRQLLGGLCQVRFTDPLRKLLDSAGLARQLLQCFGCPHIVSFGEAELRQSDLHAQLLAPFVVLCVHL